MDKALSFGEKSCTFAFQGGEPMMVGLGFFEDVVDYVEKCLENKKKNIQIQYAIQTNGYELDEWKLGNIKTDSFEEMDQKRDELGFIACSEQIPGECRDCKWYPLCRNGCRRHCEPVTATDRGKNYFCEAYKEFFEYAYPRLVEIYRGYGKF